MRLTKYEHACVLIEQDDTKIVIDPGVFTSSFDTSEQNIAAVILTHSHTDHIDTQKVTELLKTNPQMKLYAPEDTVQAYPALPIQIARANEQIKIGSFTISFTGGEHALIHNSMAPIQNIGVRINNTLYYPGDSFALPNTKVKVLLAPAAAPWLKIGTAMDFISDIEAELVIPTHDAILSEQGMQVHDSMLSNATSRAGGSYQRLRPGQTINI